MRIHISTAIPLGTLNGGGTWLRDPFLDFIRGTDSRFAKSYFRIIRQLDRRLVMAGLSNLKVISTLDTWGSNRLKNKHAPYARRFKRAFEWCSGPGFIGFHLLQHDICETLCLADINPLAVESARHTISENGLENRVTCYLSDNFESIPDHERFDLVVSNPPNYFFVNPSHPEGAKLQEDLRPNDRDWNIHRAFYSNVARYMLPGGFLIISEVEAFQDKVYIPNPSSIPYDIRPRPPVVEFREMIEAGGLEYIDTVKFYEREGVSFHMMISKAPG